MSILHQPGAQTQQSPQEQGKTDQQGKHKKVCHSSPFESLHTLPPRRLNSQQENQGVRQEKIKVLGKNRCKDMLLGQKRRLINVCQDIFMRLYPTFPYVRANPPNVNI
jgi:hypothetical protein